jgi:hypothetical protein
MQIPFSAYAEDCTVTGEIALESDRLSDLLASTDEFAVGTAAFRALDDGRVVEAESADICRDDLCVIVATGPRGRAERRLWTRQYPVRLRVGPYIVLGYLHAPPTIDPIRSTDRRPILAMTSSILEYDEAGTSIRVESDALLVNSAKIQALESATEEDLGLSKDVDLRAGRDPRAKDLTGN